MKCAPAIAALATLYIIMIAASGCTRPSAAVAGSHTPQVDKASVARVTVGQPKRKTLTLDTTQPGRIEAFEETPLYPKIAGYVEEVLVDIGDSVKEGQKLVQLWVPEMQDEQAQKEALVEHAEAEVQQAEAAVQAADAKVSTAEARVKQAEAGIARADAEYERWKSEYERLNDLATKGTVTAKLADETLNQFQAANASRTETVASVESARAELNEARANAAKSRADVTATKANHQVAMANLKRTTTLLSYTEIKAPFDGVIIRRGVDKGHYVQPASGAAAEPLLVVARTDQVRVFVDVPEMEAPYVDRGDPATIQVQSLPNREFKATVTRTSWSLNPINRSLRVEIDSPNVDGILRPGMYATVAIRLAERNGAMTLPITAIVETREGPRCCCVESGKIVFTPISVGLRSGGEVEVTSGLSGNEVVVLAQADSLSDGQSVDVIEKHE